MKVKNNKVIVEHSNSDYLFRDRLENLLKDTFKLEIKDLPVIIRKIGIWYTKYELTDYSYDEGIKFTIVVKRIKKATVEFRYGDTKVKVITIDDIKYIPIKL